MNPRKFPSTSIKPASRRGPTRSGWSRAGVVSSCVLVAVSALAVGSDQLDRQALRTFARRTIDGVIQPTDKVLALLNAVHAVRPTRENTNFFLLASLRATALQVLQHGGDCADKSRLLVALLGEIGLSATPVMCAHQDTGRPTHTVVDVFLPDGADMIVDPAYQLAFPKSGATGYHGLLDLRRDGSILTQRLDHLRESTPRRHPLHVYDPRKLSYAHAGTFHWDRDSATALAGRTLAGVLGERLHLLPRPAVLENPKLFIAAASALAAVGVFLAGRMGRRRSVVNAKRRHEHSPLFRHRMDWTVEPVPGKA